MLWQLFRIIIWSSSVMPASWDHSSIVSMQLRIMQSHTKLCNTIQKIQYVGKYLSLQSLYLCICFLPLLVLYCFIRGSLLSELLQHHQCNPRLSNVYFSFFLNLPIFRLKCATVTHSFLVQSSVSIRLSFIKINQKKSLYK